MNKDIAFLGFSIVGIIVFIAVSLCFPLVTLWAVNTLLYPVFSIPYSWSTYFATFVINWILMGSNAWNLSKIEKKL